MIKFLFGKMINDLVTKEVAREAVKINANIDTTDDKIKQHCVNLVESLFSEESPSNTYVQQHWSMHGIWRKTAKGHLEHGVADRVIAHMEETEKQRVDEKLAGEEFIDGIVERILKKQIK